LALVDGYNRIKWSLVALGPKDFLRPADEPMPMPPVLGTGFVVHESGLVATNRHVTRALAASPRPPQHVEGDVFAVAHLFRREGTGTLRVPLDIVGIVEPIQFDAPSPYYGPPFGPDLAFVQVAARNLPAVTLLDGPLPPEGTEVAVAGFPLGHHAMATAGRVEHMGPALQRGIVSAHLPFVGNTEPEYFKIDVLAQGGASGSPVFIPESGEVIGILYAGMHNYAPVIDGDGQSWAPPAGVMVATSMSYAIGVGYIRAGMASEELSRMPDVLPIEEIIENRRKAGHYKEVLGNTPPEP